MAHKLIKRIAYRLGYDLTFRRLPQDDKRRRAAAIPRDMEMDFVDIHARAQAFTMTSVERMYALYQAVRYVCRHQIPGDFVECGVWRGGSCMLMALTLQALGERGRKIHLYDTFAGMTRPGEHDIRYRDQGEQVTRWEAGAREGYNEWCLAPLDEVRRNVLATGYPEDSLVFVAGEIESTLPATAPAAIALLRLDTDWYASTRHELEHLYPLLAPGGALIIDDYGSFEGARKAVDEYFEAGPGEIFLHRIDATGRIGLKPR